MKSIIVLIAFIGIGDAQGAGRKNFLITVLEQCEGKDLTNYTLTALYTEDAVCSFGSDQGGLNEYLTTCQQNGQKVVNFLIVLARSLYPAGAYFQYESLYLATSGNLEGKYLYLKEIGLQEDILKKCSSVLGYSYILSKSHILLISEKLDPNIFLNPTGAFEPFKKFATTICQGKSITV